MGRGIRPSTTVRPSSQSLCTEKSDRDSDWEIPEERYEIFQIGVPNI